MREHLGRVVHLVGLVGTSIPTSSCGSGVEPGLAKLSSSRSRSGIRAASTWMFAVSSSWSPRFGSNFFRPGRKKEPPAISDPRYTRRRAEAKRYRPRSMAVATRAEYGLFIGGELVEPASGEVRDLAEPATGEPLARRGDGRRGGRRPRGRGGPRRARRAVGQDAAERALAPAARARRRDRREPQGARRARVAQRRQGDLVGQGRARAGASRTSASTAPRSRRSPAARTRSAARCSSTR